MIGPEDPMFGLKSHMRGGAPGRVKMLTVAKVSALVGPTPQAGPTRVRMLRPCMLGGLVIFLCSCQAQQESQSQPPGTPASRSVAQAATSSQIMTVSSTAFTNGAPIPARYTCQGANISPELKWSGVPDGAAALALLCQDPDAPSGTFTHWVVFNLPPTLTELKEGPIHLPASAGEGTNDSRKSGYTGPCPPPGKIHHYHFTVYALDTKLAASRSTTGPDLLKLIGGHVLGQVEMVGTFER